MAQDQQQGILPLPGNVDAPGPAVYGNRGGNRRRGRGARGQANRAPPAAPNLRPPRVHVAHTTGPPRPMHLATSNTPEKNDPLWTTGLGGAELQPLPNLEYVYSGCEILPQLVSVVHSSYSSASPGYARRIPESVLAYFLTVCTQYRLLNLQSANSFPLSFDEERFVEQVASLQLEVPMLMAHYLSGFGNTRSPSGRDIRFRMLDRPRYETHGEFSGWYGRVSAETQVLYQQYPCLAVSVARIHADLDPGVYAREWNLPVALRPDAHGGLGPSRALLGYAPRARLSQSQLLFIESLDVAPGVPFDSANRSLPLNLTLLNAVQLELRHVSTLKLSRLPTATVGSQGQLASIRFEDELVPHMISRSAVLECPHQIPAEISFSASAFGYRVVHDIDGMDEEDPPVAPWVVWRYELNDAVQWLPYSGNGNALRRREPEMLGIAEFRTTPYLIRARLEELDKAVSKT